ncbi:RelA/SpoT family protein, partial [bacterium]|nr:RelA/SpoT family protein [bacterium]
MIRIENIITDFQKYTDNKIDCSPIQKAYVLAVKAQPYLKLFSTNYVQNALEVAKVLVDLRLDIQSIISGILHGILIEGKISIEEITDLLGEETAGIIAGMHDILGISDIQDEKERIAEKMRQMIFASSKDIRIIFVNLAARLVRMRKGSILYNLRMKSIAVETLQIYAPIAERLGLSHIKVELEDICFSYIYPKENKEIQDYFQNNQRIHQNTLQRLSDEIIDLLPAHGITGDVTKRIKHNYSIYQKAKRMGVEYDQLHDLLGIRIIVKEIDECYKVLGIISSFYQPVTESFKDYISFPKPNGYQSLHIDVFSKDGIGFDVQIRTLEMDKVAERGIAAHWSYKDKVTTEPGSTDNTSWLTDLSQSLNFTSDPKESLEIFTRELYSDFVYVFTPKGKIIKLQSGACVLDFAYAIHTEVGQTCVGARINGRNTSIRTKLKHGDKVEIITSKIQTPNPDWIHHAKTSRALSKIRSYLRKEERLGAEKLGREIFAEEVAKMKKRLRDVLKSVELKEFLEKSGHADIESYYIHLGYGKAVINNLAEFFEPVQKKKPIKGKPSPKTEIEPKRRGSVHIAGIDNIMIHYANCCNPVKGDKVVGLVSQGQGISIHLIDCKNIRSKGFNPERLVDVEWVKSASEKLPVNIHLEFDNLIKTNLQIMKTLSAAKVILVENNLRLVDNKSYQDIKVKVDNTEQLEKILSKLNSINSVSAQRKKD